MAVMAAVLKIYFVLLHLNRIAKRNLEVFGRLVDIYKKNKKKKKTKKKKNKLKSSGSKSKMAAILKIYFELLFLNQKANWLENF